MPRRVPSLDKLERITGFRPAIPLVEIVDQVIAHSQKRKEAGLMSAPDRVAASAASD
jgi:hypothetical protein